ncbi:GNAT family N-acetyltransferase [uncultured Algibacter sp.]|uniref:GNAT family N-acetyltransferase n=1 Tax=uncultured Algibacter sp. TaxID=298659 RepID=UPI002601C954|nr:GNAT family N-acetyltransferase [uncultured Algibacter sp.]
MNLLKSININSHNYFIKLINSEETYKVRHPILRSGKPIESCAFEGDDHKTTLHLGLYFKDEIVGVCSFLKNKHVNINQESQYQLRGMAVLENFQRTGIGYELLNYAENLLKAKNTNTIWCNAREVALHFYKKNGYTIFGLPFNIGDIGLHYTMYKNL